MGNCGSNPKTNEGTEPEPVPEEVNVVGATEETPNEDNKSLSTLLNEVILLFITKSIQHSNFFFLIFTHLLDEIHANFTALNMDLR